MPAEYVCKVGVPSGDVEERRLVGESATALRAELEAKGYFIFSIRRSFDLRHSGLGSRRIPQSVVRLFSQELATLLKAGLPLFQALDVMIERQAHVGFKRSLTAIRDRVKTGSALSDAVKAEGDLYPPILTASLVAGERSGSLETVLRRFAQYLRLSEAIKRKAITASVYPVLLLSVMGALGTVLVFFVIPAFERFFHDLGGDLPALTKAVVWIARHAQQNILTILLLVTGLVSGALVWRARPGSAVKLDAGLLRIPLIGHMMRIYATSQLARTLSTLLAGGLPLLNALEVASASVGNRAMGQAIADATPLIREGKNLTHALESTGMFESLSLEMVKVGEQTGSLGEMLTALAEFYDEELDSRIAVTLALVEPLMIMLLAVVVATMLLAFYLPIFESFSRIQGGH
jgi:type IV pilus assembly protein PilC